MLLIVKKELRKTTIQRLDESDYFVMYDPNTDTNSAIYMKVKEHEDDPSKTECIRLGIGVGDLSTMSMDTLAMVYPVLLKNITATVECKYD